MKNYLVLVGLGLALVFAGQTNSCSLPDFGSIVVPAKVEKGFVVLVEETAERTPETAIVLGSQQWMNLKQKNIDFIVYDDDQREAKPFLDVIKNVKLPAIVALDASNGKVLFVEPAPTKPEQVDALASRITGK